MATVTQKVADLPALGNATGTIGYAVNGITDYKTSLSSLVTETITASKTIDGSASILLVDATAGDVDITIPSTLGAGFPVHVYKIDSSLNVVTVVAGAGVTLPGYNKIYDQGLSIKMRSLTGALYAFEEQPWIPGVPTEYNWNVDPSTLGVRILPLQGQTVLADDYPGLVALNYHGDANNAAAHAAGAGYCKTSDVGGTTPDIAGPYFLLPASEGYSVRGLDSTGTIDPDGAGRFVGDTQEDAFQGHVFSGGGLGLAGGSGLGVSSNRYLTISGVGNVSISNNPASTSIQTGSPRSDGSNGVPRISSETVGKNRSTHFGVTF